ncbi:putative amidohydrolase YtcJ [Aliiruegeria haliotis]|uniref:Putative amidohydrolase YtcJ n=1 Tax=Aliiruegeria haliotis TaxID=1280846 RepID=A0A2T0S0I0_9RHOB|nr:amidohydrolase family protein [Aliiruegeria haliotis]PRY26936.1 putative amidohydrolase YtcJ [Aliiruegeria haliotis]
MKIAIYSAASLLVAASAFAQSADRILLNGTIETMNQVQPAAEALVIKDGRILFVGDSEDAQAFVGDTTDVIDLGGKYATPGVIESHNHVVSSKWITTGVNVSDARSVDDIGRMMKEYVDANPGETGPLIGFGWMPANLGNVQPRAADLDKWDLGRPTMVIGNASHDAVLNTLALEAAGITKDTPDTQPGVIYWERDADGNPTGLAIETIFFEAYVDMGAWDPETIVPQSADFLQDFLASKGVTTAMVPGLVTPGLSISTEKAKSDMREIMAVLKEREDAGHAKLRLNVMPWYKLPDADAQDIVDFALEMKALYDTDMLRTDKIKVHPENAWLSRGATQLVPYLPANPGDAPTWGTYGVPPERLFEMVNRANMNGLDVVTHADGSRLIKRLLDIIIEAKQYYPDARNRLDHLTSMDDETRDRMVLHNVGSNASPLFYNELDSGRNGSELFKIMQEAFAREAHGQYTELAQMYDNLSLSGDAPGAPIERAYPSYLFQQSMTLIEPSIEGAQPFPDWRPVMTIDQVLNAYTRAPAWQMGMEDVIGTLEVGKYADIAIWEKNLREIAGENMIEEANVVGTLLNGEFTHRDGM